MVFFYLFFFYSTNISIIRFKYIKDIMFKYFVFIFLNILVDGWMHITCFSLFQITVLVLQLGLSLFSLTLFLFFTEKHPRKS